jgi:small subunit ribosomal protein S6
MTLLPRKDRGRQTRGGEHVLRHYEIMVILDGSLEERTVAPSLDTYLNVIRTSGGSVEKLDVWGRRRLSYEINKKTEGIYAVIDLQAEPAYQGHPARGPLGGRVREDARFGRVSICSGA